MRYCFFTFWMMLIASSLVGCGSTPLTVEQFGAMREVMRGGQTEPRISLAEIVSQPHAVAVGALEGLGGEITIVDGDVWVSRVVDGDLQVTGPEPIADDQATLLTLTHVAKWKSITIETAVEGSELESLIEETAREQGVDTTKPFPFVIEGTMTDVRLHVINGYCPIATDPATMDAEPWHWSSEESVGGMIVGFYAPDSAGVMTHHGTSIHAHGIFHDGDSLVVGHMDGFIAVNGGHLKIGR